MLCILLIRGYKDTNIINILTIIKSHFIADKIKNYTFAAQI